MAHYRWETVNAVLYKVGGAVFIVGSVLFFPRFEAYADIGAWTFFFGSLLYLVVTGHDMAEAIRYRWTLARRTLASDCELVAAGPSTQPQPHPGRAGRPLRPCQLAAAVLAADLESP